MGANTSIPGSNPGLSANWEPALHVLTTRTDTMDGEFLIVKNIAREGPGLLEAILEERQISYEVVDLESGQAFPPVRACSALVVLGGPDSANDETRKMRIELARIEECLGLGKPYLGICLGMQALVKAGGGKVVKSPTREVGFRDPEGRFFEVDLTEDGGRDPLFNNVQGSFKVFHLHGETVELTGTMKLLGTGRFCRNQIARVGEHAYGLQCHVELTPLMLNVWIREDPDLGQLDQEGLWTAFRQIQEEYARVGRQLL